MTDYMRNSYEDDDLRQVLEKHEKWDAECEAIMASARGKVSAIRDKQKVAKKVAVDDLRIPRGVLNPMIKRRKKEREIKKLDEAVDEELREVYVDACGQFAMFAPVFDEVTSDEAVDDAPPAKKAKRGRKPKATAKPKHVDASESDAAVAEAIANVTAQEQLDGDTVFEEALH